MKRFFGFLLLLSAVSIPAFAAKNSQNFTFFEPTMVGTTQIPAGDYKISWTGTDENLTVTIAQGKKVLATFTAKREPVNNDHIALGTRTEGSTSVLENIQLKDCNLVVTKPAATGEEESAH